MDTCVEGYLPFAEDAFFQPRNCWLEITKKRSKVKNPRIFKKQSEDTMSKRGTVKQAAIHIYHQRSMDYEPAVA